MSHQKRNGWFLSIMIIALLFFAAFDDFYLGVEQLNSQHSILGSNLLKDPGAEGTEIDVWEQNGWKTLPTMVPYGIIFFPPCSFSGARFFFGGGTYGVEGGLSEPSTLSQRINLTPYQQLMENGNFALRWGGWLRTIDAANTVSLSLEIYDGDDSLWGTVNGGNMFDAEWRSHEYLTRIPTGASAVRLIVSSNLAQVGSSALADALYVTPERVD